MWFHHNIFLLENAQRDRVCDGFKRVALLQVYVACFRAWQARKISSNVIEAMRLTINEHHRKLRGVGDISDWFISADVLGFCHTDILGPEDSFTFVSSTNSCCLLRLSVSSYNFLLPPTTTCCLPQLPRCDRYLRHLALSYFYSVVTAYKHNDCTKRT